MKKYAPLIAIARGNVNENHCISFQTCQNDQQNQTKYRLGYGKTRSLCMLLPGMPNDAAAMEKQGGGSSETIQIELLHHLAILLLVVFQNNVNQDLDQISTLTLMLTAALLLTVKICKQH